MLGREGAPQRVVAQSQAGSRYSAFDRSDRLRPLQLFAQGPSAEEICVHSPLVTDGAARVDSPTGWKGLALDFVRAEVQDGFPAPAVRQRGAKSSRR